MFRKLLENTQFTSQMHNMLIVELSLKEREWSLCNFYFIFTTARWKQAKTGSYIKTN